MTSNSSIIGFAHRGGMDHARANTMAAFTRALAHGATGIETDAWLTADDVVILDHDGKIGRLWRRRSIRSLRLEELPNHIPRLTDLLTLAGPEVHVFMDIKDDAAFEAVLSDVRKHRKSLDRIWLAHSGFRSSDWRHLAKWRELAGDAHLVDSTSVRRFDVPAPAYAARAVEHGVDAINLRAREWTPELATTFHAAGLQCLAFSAHSRKRLERAAAAGIDAMHSNDVDTMMAVINNNDH